MTVVRNPARRPLPPVVRTVHPLAALHRHLPGYRPTPLFDVPALARDWDVGRVLVKHEADRFGLPSFKVLGASWAVHRLLCGRAGLPPDTAYDAVPRSTAPTRLVTATDGNHGRAVAWAAGLFGLTAEVHIPAGAAAVRVDAIRGQGAAVVLVDGDYDDAVASAAAAADGDQAVLVQDTYVPGHEQVPAWIGEGYATLLEEIDDTVDVVLVPTGVGSLAGAVVDRYAADPTRVVTVEPTDAACVLASVQRGDLEPAKGPHRTAMAGLNCATPSAIAWPRLQARVDACVAVGNTEAEAAMRMLHAAGIATGATGAAAAAGAADVCTDDQARRDLQLAADSTVLLLVTEGVTDPEHHARVTAGLSET